MLIIAHRGLHSQAILPNSPDALINACSLGFGIETDLRDFSGRLVVSHDPADSFAPDAETLLRTLAPHNAGCCLALNIKSDGLKPIISQCLARTGITNYFLFDMSIPQMKIYADSGLVYFTGHSDIQPQPVLYENASGIWADCFYSENWITREVIAGHISCGKKICFVSPELHGRKNYRDFWSRLRDYDSDYDSGSLMICTDYPQDAQEFFTERG